MIFSGHARCSWKYSTCLVLVINIMQKNTKTTSCINIPAFNGKSRTVVWHRNHATGFNRTISYTLSYSNPGTYLVFTEPYNKFKCYDDMYSLIHVDLHSNQGQYIITNKLPMFLPGTSPKNGTIFPWKVANHTNPMSSIIFIIANAVSCCCSAYRYILYMLSYIYIFHIISTEQIRSFTRNSSPENAPDPEISCQLILT